MYPCSVGFLKKSCLNTRANVNEMHCYVLCSFKVKFMLIFCRH